VALFPHPVSIGKEARARLKGQRPGVVWLTGLSGAGKSTIAGELARRLQELGHHVAVLEGEDIRDGLSRDLGFSDAHRSENVRRMSEVSKLMVDAGLIVIASAISPFACDRRRARELLEEGEFVEVFVDAPLAVAESRDPKRLYARARRGEIDHVSGIDSPYEPPEQPELHFDTSRAGPDQAAEAILQELRRRGVLGAG
jgi:bifunctional enzyme CysN/CysC